MSYLGRDGLMACTARRFADVEINGVGTVRIQSLTEMERQTAAKKSTDSPEMLTGRFIAAAVVDERGFRIWSDDQIDQIMSLDAAITIPLVSAIEDHINGRTIEELGKNSPETTVDDSP